MVGFLHCSSLAGQSSSWSGFQSTHIYLRGFQSRRSPRSTHPHSAHTVPIGRARQRSATRSFSTPLAVRAWNVQRRVHGVVREIYPPLQILSISNYNRKRICTHTEQQPPGCRVGSYSDSKPGRWLVRNELNPPGELSGPRGLPLPSENSMNLCFGACA